MGELQAQPEKRFLSRRHTAIAVVVAVLIGAASRLIDPELRPWNFTVLGALALFVAARVGLLPSVLLTLASFLLSDSVMFFQNNYHTDYLPSIATYFCFALYGVLGWVFLRNTESPLRIAGATIGAGLIFFVVSNFGSWVIQTEPYGYTLKGLLNCYIAGVPFYRGTLTGDILFTIALFGLYAVLVRVLAPTEHMAPVAEESRV